MLLQLFVGVVDAQLLEVVLNEDLETEDVEHPDELVGVLSLKQKIAQRQKEAANSRSGETRNLRAKKPQKFRIAGRPRSSAPWPSYRRKGNNEPHV